MFSSGSSHQAQEKRKNLIKQGESVISRLSKYSLKPPNSADKFVRGIEANLKTMKFDYHAWVSSQLMEGLRCSLGLLDVLLDNDRIDLALDLWIWYIATVDFVVILGNRQNNCKVAQDMLRMLVEKVSTLPTHYKTASAQDKRMAGDKLRPKNDSQVNTVLWKELADYLVRLVNDGHTELAAALFSTMKQHLVNMLTKKTNLVLAGKFWEILMDQLTSLMRMGKTTQALDLWKKLLFCLADMVSCDPSKVPSHWFAPLAGKLKNLMVSNKTKDSEDWWVEFLNCLLDLLRRGKSAVAEVFWSHFAADVLKLSGQEEVMKFWKILVEYSQKENGYFIWEKLAKEAGQKLKCSRIKKSADFWLLLMIQIKMAMEQRETDKAKQMWSILIDKFPDNGNNTTESIWQDMLHCIVRMPKKVNKYKQKDRQHDERRAELWHAVSEMWNELAGCVTNHSQAFHMLTAMVGILPEILEDATVSAQLDLVNALLNSMVCFSLTHDSKATEELSSEFVQKTPEIMSNVQPEAHMEVFSFLLDHFICDPEKHPKSKVKRAHWENIVKGVVNAAGNSEPSVALEMWKMLVKMTENHWKAGNLTGATDMWKILVQYTQPAMNKCPELNVDIWKASLEPLPGMLDKKHIKEIKKQWGDLVKVVADHPSSDQQALVFWTTLSDKIMTVLRKDKRDMADNMWGSLINLVPTVLSKGLSDRVLVFWEGLFNMSHGMEKMGKQDMAKKMKRDLKEEFTHLLQTKQVDRKLQQQMIAFFRHQSRITSQQQQKSVQPGTYPMESSPRGQALIISNIKFPKYPDLNRDGAEEDEELLTEVLKILDFHVRVMRNLDRDDMQATIQKFAANWEHETSDAAVLAVMTHGSDKGLFGTDMKPLTTEKVVQYFSNGKAPKLADKPKWLLFQACRAKETDKQIADGGSIFDTVRGWGKQYGHICITYATVPGHYAWRDQNHGSWMMQILCQKIKELWEICDLHDILLKTQEAMEGRSHGDSRQTMEVSLRGWNKKLYFSEKAMETPRGATAEPAKQASKPPGSPEKRNKEPEKKGGFFSGWWK